MTLPPKDPMTTFDDREQGFERKFALDQEQEFKAHARRNRTLGECTVTPNGGLELLFLIKSELFLEAPFPIVEGGHVVPMAARNRGHISRPAASRNRKPGSSPKFAPQRAIR